MKASQTKFAVKEAQHETNMLGVRHCKAIRQLQYQVGLPSGIFMMFRSLPLEIMLGHSPSEIISFWKETELSLAKETY